MERGEPVLLLHLWNERLPGLDPLSPGLKWAKTFQRALLCSLAEVACYLNDHPEIADVRAVGGITVLLDADDHTGGTRLVERLGFTVTHYTSPLGGFGEFWESLYSWVLIWTYSPTSLPYRHLGSLRRKEFWISTREFRCRFGKDKWGLTLF